MMEITAIGMGLMMMGVAVTVGGLMLEATFLMLGRALRSPSLAASVEPAAIHPELGRKIHYNGLFKSGLAAQEKNDLVEYLKSL